MNLASSRMRNRFPRLAAHEVGFAFLVAVIIWSVFELSTRLDDETRWHSRVQVISKNVFMAVFRRRLPDDLLSEVTVLIFDHNFIRNSVHMTYTICDQEFLSRNGSKQWFVCLHASVRMRITNVSETKAKLPLRMYLPNPLIDEMKEFCRVKSASYRINDVETFVDLSTAEERFRNDIKDDTKSSILFELSPIDVLPGVTIEVSWYYTMAKHDEDTEIFQTMVPAKHLIVTIIDTNPKKRIVRAESIHRSELREDISARAQGTYNFYMDGYILPYQGFSVWWKNLPPPKQPAALRVDIPDEVGEDRHASLVTPLRFLAEGPHLCVEYQRRVTCTTARLTAVQKCETVSVSQRGVPTGTPLFFVALGPSYGARMRATVADLGHRPATA